MDQYELLKPIAKGKYTVVYQARRRVDNSPVALKKISLALLGSKARDKCLREARLIQSHSSSHPNLLSYLDTFFVGTGGRENEEGGRDGGKERGRALVIVTEWAAAGDLARQIRKAKARREGGREGEGLVERLIWKWFGQVCDAVEHLHGHAKILHRNLNPSNVFLNLQGVVKVGGVGLSALLAAGCGMEESGREEGKEGVRPVHLPPEVLKGDGAGWKSDVWGLGCLLYQMASLDAPFYDVIGEGREERREGVVGRMGRAEYAPLGGCYSEELKELVRAMLSSNPCRRPDVATVRRIAQQMLQQQLQLGKGGKGRGGGRRREGKQEGRDGSTVSSLLSEGVGGEENAIDEKWGGNPRPPSPSSPRRRRMARRQWAEGEGKGGREGGKEGGREETNVDAPPLSSSLRRDSPLSRRRRDGRVSSSPPPSALRASSSRMVMIGLEEESEGGREGGRERRQGYNASLDGGMEGLSLYEQQKQQQQKQQQQQQHQQHQRHHHYPHPQDQDQGDERPATAAAAAAAAEAVASTRRAIIHLQRRIHAKQQRVAVKQSLLHDLDAALFGLHQRASAAAVEGGMVGARKERRVLGLVEVQEAVLQLKEENKTMCVKEGLLWSMVQRGRLKKAEEERRKRRRKRWEQQQQRRKGVGGMTAAVMIWRKGGLRKEGRRKREGGRVGGGGGGEGGGINGGGDEECEGFGGRGGSGGGSSGLEEEEEEGRGAEGYRNIGASAAVVIDERGRKEAQLVASSTGHYHDPTHSPSSSAFFPAYGDYPPAPSASFSSSASRQQYGLQQQHQHYHQCYQGRLQQQHHYHEHH